jgi:uncharacterized membrane protein
MTLQPIFACALAAGLLAACSPVRGGIDPSGQTFDAIGPTEVISLIGTEPFWNVRIADGAATYANPEHPDGHPPFAVTRFAGNNGLGFSGTFSGAAFTATLTPGECSDGMSDRTYPYIATVAIADRTLSGCGYTDKQPFAGDPTP